MPQQTTVDVPGPRPSLFSRPIGRTEPWRYDVARGVHGGAGELHFQELLGGDALGESPFLFLHRGVLPPGGGIGHHFHHQMEEMFVILDGEAEFTIDGRASRLAGPAGAPCRMGHSHAIYNPTGADVQWLNIAVGSRPGAYDCFDLLDDRVGAPLDPRPVFVTIDLARDLLPPSEDGVWRRRVLDADVFLTTWDHVDHVSLDPGATTDERVDPDLVGFRFVIAGSGTAKFEGETIAIGAGDAFPVRRGQRHSLAASDVEPIELLAVGIGLVDVALSRASPNRQATSGSPDQSTPPPTRSPQ